MKQQDNYPRTISWTIAITLLIIAGFLTGCGLFELASEYTPEPGVEGLVSGGQSALSTVGPESRATSTSVDETPGADSGTVTGEQQTTSAIFTDTPTPLVPAETPVFATMTPAQLPGPSPSPTPVAPLPGSHVEEDGYAQITLLVRRLPQF